MMRIPASATVLGLLFVMGCAGIPSGRYGIDSVTIEGMESFDEAALATCLTTRQRDSVTLQFRSDPVCGEAPFSEGATLRLWRWPWTRWPLYDPTAFRQDLRRIRRWYEARGFHHAEVTGVTVSPPEADAIREEGDDRCTHDEDADTRRCRVDIVIQVDEGQPTLVSRRTLAGIDTLPADLQEEMQDALTLAPGQRFDEATYDALKSRLRELLSRRSYALATIRGEVRVERDAYQAEIDLHIDPGPPCTFGELEVRGHGDLPLEPIVDAARLDTGDPYDSDRLTDIQRAVFALGMFSSVVAEPEFRPEGAEHRERVNVVVRVNPGRESRFRIGGGIQGGLVDSAQNDGTQDVPQWDLHATGSWEHRNLFGGYRRFRVVERPRLIFGDRFPRATTPRLGNRVSVEFEQPGFLEARLKLTIDAQHDFGPDSYAQFFRHDFESGIGFHRRFFNHRLLLSAGIRGHLYRVADDESDNPNIELPADSHLMYFSQSAELDLRDNSGQPTRGIFAAFDLHEAGFILPSSWSYYRLLTRFRFFAPFGRRLVLAGRFDLGFLFLQEAAASLDDEGRSLGPVQYRLRGGGASSNRGFLPGHLGDGEAGGIRRWLATLELRIRITENLGSVIFGDAGDVSATSRLRFDYPQLTLGLGLRYQTIIGPIRLDIGFQVPGAQVLANEDERLRRVTSRANFGFASFPGAVHLTIGESF